MIHAGRDGWFVDWILILGLGLSPSGNGIVSVAAGGGAVHAGAANGGGVGAGEGGDGGAEGGGRVRGRRRW